jgi:hypothetical protein
VVQVRLVLLPLILLDPDFLLLQPLILQPVLFQLDNKVNNYFSSRFNKFQDPDQAHFQPLLKFLPLHR